MTKRTFYECRKCGFYHPVGFNGTCEDIENRYDGELLDERFPEGWAEIDQPIIQNPNLFRLEQLRPETDLNGNRLEVGCRVRVFVSAHYVRASDTLSGIAITETSGAAIDGVLEAIGEIKPDDPTPRYRVRCTNEDLPEYDHRLFSQTGELCVINRIRRTCPTDDFLHPVINGHLDLSCSQPSPRLKGLMSVDPTDKCPSFRVFRI